MSESPYSDQVNTEWSISYIYHFHFTRCVALVRTLPLWAAWSSSPSSSCPPSWGVSWPAQVIQFIFTWSVHIYNKKYCRFHRGSCCLCGCAQFLWRLVCQLCHLSWSVSCVWQLAAWMAAAAVTLRNIVIGNREKTGQRPGYCHSGCQLAKQFY